MLSEWRKATTESIAAPTKSALATGPFGSAIGKKTFRPSGVPVIRGSNLSSDTGTRLIDSDLVFVDPELAKKFQRSIARRGDLVFTCWGTTNQVGFIDDRAAYDEYIVSNKQMKLTPDADQAIPEFLYYFFSSPDGQAAIQSHSIGSSVPGFNLTGLKQICVPLPPLNEQALIVDLLSSLDDKIELNRRMNEALEAMARAIFKDWFVDFGPTRAKAESRAPYLAPEIWNLFPDALDDEDKPVGWKTYTLADLAQHHRATVSPSAEPESIFEHYSIPAYDAGNEPTLDPGGLIKSNKTVVPEGSVLLSKLNPEIERVWLPNPKGEPLQVASTEFLAFTPLASATRVVLFCLFKSEAFRAEMAAMVTGTSKSHQRVSPKSLLTRNVLIAEPQLLAAFDDLARPFLDRVLANRREARTLGQTRDLLLPKLMSGEIRLREAERMVEAVA